MPLTEGQLRSKRDEFWETAPAFEGRKEIWDALRAATHAAESLDFQLAQAILDGANIFLANGYLTEVYDELGAHYKIPIYCLSHPVNIVKEDHDSESPAEYSEPVDGGKFPVLCYKLFNELYMNQSLAAAHEGNCMDIHTYSRLLLPFHCFPDIWEKV